MFDWFRAILLLITIIWWWLHDNTKNDKCVEKELFNNRMVSNYAGWNKQLLRNDWLCPNAVFKTDDVKRHKELRREFKNLRGESLTEWICSCRLTSATGGRPFCPDPTPWPCRGERRARRKPDRWPGKLETEGSSKPRASTVWRFSNRSKGAEISIEIDNLVCLIGNLVDLSGKLVAT